ncbi:MAG: response regulator, partial [Treponemataceae bacterium]|nr:response regulator [Treponemataceae bacterium]
FMSKPLFASSVMSEFTAALRKKHLVTVAAEPPKVDLHGRRILLAEDMQINMEIMKELLDMEGMEVEHAENGQVAVDMFRASDPGHFDAVLMDVRMPVMDGLKATAAIRALDHPDAKDIPIIAMTANAFDEDVQHSLQAGMTAHLTKPVEPEKLYRSLAELIGARLAR